MYIYISPGMDSQMQLMFIVRLATSVLEMRRLFPSVRSYIQEELDVLKAKWNRK